MSFYGKLTEIDHLQQSIQIHGKLGKELLIRINYKFRLDWNYYSNRMEGNTLTLDETKSVMIGNINVHNKPLKDVLEMKGHDEVVQSILKMGKGELNISESRIKKLHEEIMYEDSPTEKEKIGQWKLQPNHVINYRDEKFNFTDPSDVKEKMHGLVNWLNAEKEKIETGKKDALHPVEIAFDFHLRYLTIHPFYDGNGRTARIMTNLILISFGYPPIYIKDNEKQPYYRHLADIQGYGADKYLLFELMSGYLLRSLDIVINAIEGKPIEEPEDLDKKIRLLEKELHSFDENKESKTIFSNKIFFKIFDDWLADAIKSSIHIVGKFRKLFLSNRHFLSVNLAMVAIEIDDQPAEKILHEFIRQIRYTKGLTDAPFEINISTNFKHLAGVSSTQMENLTVHPTVKIYFSRTRYQIFVDDFDEKKGSTNSKMIFDKSLDEPLSTEELSNLASTFGNSIYNFIDFNIKKHGAKN